MMFKEVRCHYCSKLFSREIRKVNEALKFEWKQYCSPKCLSRSRTTSIGAECANCSKKYIRNLSQLKKNKLNHSFCSQSCGAVYNNHLRSLSLPIKICKAQNCKRRVASWSIYCSISCRAYSKKRIIDSLKNEVLSRIRNFYFKNQRIPFKKEMYDAYKKARNAFGTWNNAVKATGFKPNPVMFANKHIAKDGHRCDSLAEKIIDEWLCSKNIPHKRSVSYPEFKKITCDFVVKDFYIEFFGLDSEHRKYTKMVYRKRRLSKKYGIKLIELKPNHLFPKNQLNEVLSFLT